MIRNERTTIHKQSQGKEWMLKVSDSKNVFTLCQDVTNAEAKKRGFIACQLRTVANIGSIRNANYGQQSYFSFQPCRNLKCLTVIKCWRFLSRNPERVKTGQPDDQRHTIFIFHMRASILHAILVLHVEGSIHMTPSVSPPVSPNFT